MSEQRTTSIGGIAPWLRYADMHPWEQPWPNAELSGVSGWHGSWDPCRIPEAASGQSALLHARSSVDEGEE